MDRLELPDKIDHKSSKNGDKDLKLKRNVAVKFADVCLRLLASSEDDASRDDNTLRLLKLKHPPSPADLALPDPPGEDDALPAAAGEEDIRKALSSFRPESTGGPDGLRPGNLMA